MSLPPGASTPAPDPSPALVPAPAPAGRTWWGVGVAVAVALLYAVATQLLFRSAGARGLASVMSVGFLFLVPLVCGVITVALAPREEGASAAYALFMPWLPCLALGAFTVAFALDVLICVAMAMPILFFMASLGGISTWALRRALSSPAIDGGGRRPELLGVALVALGPYLMAPLEQQAPAPDSYRTVETRIVVDASPAEVWRQVVRVPHIADGEQRGSVFYALGLPRPRQADLSHEGVGGVRTARFDAGLTFLETVTTWEEGQRLGFTIKIDRGAPMPPPLAAVGGPYFDILDGEFRLRPLAGGGTLLELTSHQRVSTRFNPYAGLWTDWIMRDLQDSILAVIAHRAAARG